MHQCTNQMSIFRHYQSKHQHLTGQGFSPGNNYHLYGRILKRPYCIKTSTFNKLSLVTHPTNKQ